MTDMTPQDVTAETLKKTFVALKRAEARVASLEARRVEPIAIVGMACRLPGGANDPEALWSLLARGADTVGPIPADRWDEALFYSAAADSPGRTHAAQANFLDTPVDAFDAPFFGVSAREALSMDPQQRLLLELGWEALEDAGIDAATLRGSATGVFVGISSDDYAQAHRHSGRLDLIDGYALTGTCLAPAAGRISYTFGFEGPSMAIDTACSSSLVALHLACQSLRDGESDVALAAGVNLMLSPVFHIASSKLGTISPDGLCKTFDEAADGYGRGEGGGMVVLKRLSDAQADGDRILAVVRGSAVNQDGKSNGLTAPNGLAQERVIREALDRAGLAPGDIDYIEVHGTGTALGDPIEVEAIGRVMQDRPADRPVVLGTVKSNIGHLEAAAGIAGLIRAVQCLRHDAIPAHLHLDRPSAHIPWGRYPFEVVTERTPWPRGDRPRRAGVSSFGFSGTNAHVILEEAPLPTASRAPAGVPGETLVLPLSARTPDALRELARRWRDWLSAPTAPLAAAVATAAAGRHHMAERLALVGRDADELIAGLTAFIDGKPGRAVATGSARGERPRIAGLFTGQGSQYAGMGRGLYDSEPVFRATIDACDAAMADRLDPRLIDLLYGETASDATLQQTGFAQPALFAVELALYRLWESWGVRPDSVCGHSIGEFAAAHIAGVLSFDAAVELVCARGQLMQALPPGGAMAAVFAREAIVAPLLTAESGISLAAVNTPDDVVVSGPADAVADLLATLEQRGIRAQPLRVSHAFHSALMQPMVAAFASVATRAFGSATVPIVSTVTARRAAPDEMASPAYWARQIEAPVRFAAAAAALAADGATVFLEYGPAPVLAGLAQQSVDPDGRQFLGSLARGADDDRAAILLSLARLYASGVEIDWKAVYHPHRTRVAVPTYPFQRTPYYRAPIVDAGRHAPTVGAGHSHPYLGQRIHSRLLPGGAGLYQAQFSADAPAFLVEHQIFGKIISPAAAHLSMAFAAAGAGRALEDVSFTAPLVIEAAAPRLVQLAVTGDDPPVYTVASQPVGTPGDAWTVHSEGRMIATPARPDPVDLAAIRRRCPGTTTPAAFYALIETLGYKTGENFQCIREIAKGDGEALCTVVAPQPIDGAAIHPGLIDSLLQTVLPACEQSAAHLLDGESVLIPLHMARVGLYGSLDQPLFCHSRVEVAGELVKAELVATTAQGDPVLAIEGFLLKRTDRATLYQDLRDDDSGLVQRIAWQTLPLAPGADPAADGWIILRDGDGAVSAWGRAMAAHLDAIGAACLALGPDDDFAEALGPWLAQAAPARLNLLFAADAPDADPVADVQTRLAALLPVVQMLNRAALPVPLRLWVLTCQAQAVVPEDAGVPRATLGESALWGFGRAIASEMPELWGGLVDLDPRPSAAGVAALAALVAQPGGEDQLALRRGGQAFAARLVPATQAPRDALPMLADGEKYRLDRGPLRTLDDLRFTRLARAAPASDEVEIEVLAAGLNFRDVLNALGQYPGEAGLLGFEAVGKIVALGSAAGGLALGDTVIALAAPGCIGSHVTVKRALVVKKPADLSAVTAVALPAALLTAYYALHHLGKMQRGDRVLIHAAAGGVGMAAVQLALAAGAEVFATVGSPEKRAVLEAMGVTHILNSRNLDFVEQIHAATGGRGVTMVLNSLSGAFIAASFDVLAPGGRFLEMGKIGIWDAAQVHARDPDALYRPFDLAAVALEDPASLVAMFERLLEDVAQGRLAPLPVTVFPLAEAEEAFRFMAQARHIGKIVLSREAEARRVRAARDGLVRADAHYLVTGGLGALGLRVARWLVDSGARHLVLAGRRGPSDAARDAIAALEADGATVTVVAADVGSAPDVARIVAAAAQPPLAGVFHAAGLLEDGMIADLDLAQLDRIVAPKATGGWLLHQATRQRDLDLFVCFSSVAAIIGNLGQGGYAAANAALDGLALYRRRQGLAATSLNWGPWAEAGMAAALETDRFAAQGIRQIAPAQALRTMARLLADPPVQAVVAEIDWAAYGRAHGLDDTAGLFAALVGAAAPETAQAAEAVVARDIVAELHAALPGEREEMMRRYLQELARQTLGYAHGEPIAANRPLADQGFDSLMSVDMRNRLNRGLGRTLPASLLFDYPTLDRIGRHLLDTVMTGADPAATPEPPSGASTNADAILAEIESLIGATPVYEPAAE